jgi:hypothetical protein
VAFCAGVLALTSTRTIAHHSFAAEFSAAAPVQLQGTISRIDFVNPHVWIYLDVKQPDGTIENWQVEMTAPNRLARQGLTRNSLRAGSDVSITGIRAKDGRTRAKARELTLPGGRKVLVESQDPAAPHGTASPQAGGW